MPADEDTPSSSATVAATAEARPDAPPARNAAALDAEVRATMRAEPLSDRYPRHGWGKTLRWLLALAWAAFVAYMYQVGNAIIPLWIDGQTPTGDDIANALLLGRLIPAIQHAPLLALAVPVVVLVALVLLSAAAARDIKKEREFIRDHESWQQDYERKRNALLAAEAHKAATAAHTTARETREQLPELIRQHAGSLKDSTPATPAGPPLDFSLLPEPEHFVGREADLAWVEDRLRQGGTSAIVAAIAGLGGIGKTALAAVAVRKLYAEGRFKDGIAVVSCPGRGDAAGVLRDVLLRFVPQDVSPEATIADLVTLAVNRLSGRDALVVLDNVEPELFIADVLQPLRDAHLTVLLTARQTLPLPPDARHELDLLTESAALDLFAEWYGRANAAALTSAELASARKIVGALGNHTLAVKLAGAQAADLTIPLDQFAAQVAAHPLDLEDQGADVTLALKERLMRSVNALPTDGDLGDVRRFFAALAAFAVPARDADDPDRVRLVPSLEFGRRAAKAVAEALNLPDPDRALNLLVRRALLDKDTDETLAAEADSVRLRMHPLLRELGAELLDDPTRAAASLAIAVFYAEYANEMPDAALTPDAENITGALSGHMSTRPTPTVTR